MAKTEFTSYYRKSLRRAVRYLNQSDWEVGFFNNDIFYGESTPDGGMQTEQLMPFLEDFQYNEKDNIISYELNNKGLDLVDFEFEKNSKTSVSTKLTNKASNPNVEGEEYELYVTALQPEKIHKNLNHKKTNIFNINMKSTDSRNDQISVISGILDMESGLITLNALTQQAGLTSSKEILLVNNDLF